MGPKVDAALQRDEIVVPQVSGTGLACGSGKNGVNHGDGARSRLNRTGQLDRMAAWRSASGKCRLGGRPIRLERHFPFAPSVPSLAATAQLTREWRGCRQPNPLQRRGWATPRYSSTCPLAPWRRSTIESDGFVRRAKHVPVARIHALRMGSNLEIGTSFDRSGLLPGASLEPDKHLSVHPALRVDDMTVG